MSVRISRILLVPRWAGTPASDWYPWIARSFARSPSLSRGERRPESVARGGQIGAPSLEVLSMPDPELPTIERWIPAVRRALDDGPLAETLLLGHSVGAQAVLRTLAGLAKGERVAGALLVAAWWSVDQAWDSLRPWMDQPFDHARAKAGTARCVALISDDDPFSKDHAATRATFEARLGAQVLLEPGAKHFNKKEEPAVLRALREMV